MPTQTPSDGAARPEALDLLKQGIAIPASPLALTPDRKHDPAAQRTLYRYYAAAGAGGIAVGVHTTQFEIRDPEVALFEPVLEFAAQELRRLEQEHQRVIVRVAGVCGDTPQAIAEAALSRSLGYDAVLLSLAAMKDASVDELISHCQAVGEVMPLIGFYLQPAVGGRALPYEFWRRFAALPSVVAIKMAPFNRYQTIDVMRGVADSGRAHEVTLYTGNDDNILVDLLTPYTFPTNDGGEITLRIRGGLLGQFCVWTKTAVEILHEIHQLVDSGRPVPVEWLRKNVALTDANAVIFDVAHNFAGCIPGIHEVLHRQGLMLNILCLNPDETLSPGQGEELDRICRSYPFLTDDVFVAAHLAEWQQD
ncbi:dihydrodipicolinate synthase family protein [candidate division BRC1 bacterium HGW-BRC1-1]|jgi:hypothetical protein|nr:MAG: dihydrodipicolinate synthase family protein [candidate division BRC1 bacterium HGW-BRC1-1]